MANVDKTTQIFVHTTLEAAFEYVSDLSFHTEWNSGLKIEEVAPGPVIVGKEYISHGKVLVQKERPNTLRVSHYEPPYKFGFVANDPDFGEAAHVFTFNAQNGDVRITRTMTLKMNPILAFLFNTLIYPLVSEPSMEKSMASLKVELEKRRKVSS